MSLATRIDKLDTNYIVNGNFDFWQRGTSNTGGYLADRISTSTNTGTIASTRSTDVPDATAPYSLQIAATAATNPQVFHRIEDIFAMSLASKNVTFKVRYKVTDATATPLKIIIATPNVANNYATTTTALTATINAAPTNGVWASYTVTLAMPSSASRGIQIVLYRDSGVTNVNTTTLFSQLQMVEGTFTDLNYCYASRNVFQELLLCKRYYQKSFSVNFTPANGGNTTTLAETPSTTFFVSNTGSPSHVRLEVEMRAVPTIVRYGNSTGAWLYYAANNAAVVASTTIAAGQVSTKSIGWTQQDVATNPVLAAGHWTADAEL